MAIVKRKTNNGSDNSDKIKQQWDKVMKRLTQHKKNFETKIKILQNDIKKKVSETETAIAKFGATVKSSKLPKKMSKTTTKTGVKSRTIKPQSKK